MVITNQIEEVTEADASPLFMNVVILCHDRLTADGKQQFLGLVTVNNHSPGKQSFD